MGIDVGGWIGDLSCHLRQDPISNWYSSQDGFIRWRVGDPMMVTALWWSDRLGCCASSVGNDGVYCGHRWLVRLRRIGFCTPMGGSLSDWDSQMPYPIVGRWVVEVRAGDDDPALNSVVVSDWHGGVGVWLAVKIAAIDGFARFGPLGFYFVGLADIGFLWALPEFKPNFFLVWTWLDWVFMTQQME